MTNPDCAHHATGPALVTDSGGDSCHAAIVGRELHLPTVVATRTATTVLRDGEMVTVDGARGTAPRRTGVPHASHGDRRRHRVRRARRLTGRAGRGACPRDDRDAALRQRFIADHAEEVAALPVDGVGLLRAEFMITDAAGEHLGRTCWPPGAAPSSSTGCRPRSCASRRPSPPAPWSTVRSTRHQRVPRAVRRRGVRARRGEPDDRHRGCYRYIRDPELFALTDVIARVREQTPNLHLMILFVRTRWELEACLRGHRRALRRQRGCTAGDGGGGAVGRVPIPEMPPSASTASRSAPTTSPS